MSLLKNLITAQKTPAPQAAPEEPVESIVERKVAAAELPDTDIAPNHDPEHPNHAYRQHLLAGLKKRNPHVYAKIMSWD